MKIIKPNVELIDIATPGKKMEYAGRICYLSRDRITDDSYVKFVSTIVKSGHCSILEHERLIVKIDMKKGGNPLLTISQKNHMKYFNINNCDDGIMYISANIRGWFDSIDNDEIIYDNGLYSLLKSVYPYIFKKELEKKQEVDCKIVNVKELPEEIRKFHDCKTFDIVCSRACTHQLVRHRTLTFSQQSQRYVNFSKDKFGHSINFIIPETVDENFKKILTDYFIVSENNYFDLINKGLKPEDARSVLPNATATQIVITGTTADWESFIKLRSDTHAQDEIREISNTIKNYLKIIN